MVTAQAFVILPSGNITDNLSDRNNNSGTCTDNIFMKLDEFNYKTFTLKIPLNDRFPIFMYINKIRATKDAHAMNHINYNKLKTEAELINWSELSLINEPNLALNNLVSKIKICLSKAEYSKKDYKMNIEPIHSSARTGEMLPCTSGHKYHVYGPNFVYLLASDCPSACVSINRNCK